MSALVPRDRPADLRICGDRRRRPLDQNGALDQDGDPPRQPKDQIHIVLDDQQRDVGRQALDDLDDRAAFARRHPGRRLVEQQDFGRQGQRDGNLDQPLAAVGEHVYRAQCVIFEPQLFEQGMGFLDRPAMMAGRPKQAAADPVPLADRKGHVFENAQAAEQRGDLKCPGETAFDPHGLRQVSDIGAVEMDLPGARLQCSRHQLDKGRFTGSVRPDQGVPRAAVQTKIDGVSHSQRTEALVQSAGLERRPVHRRNRSKNPSTPPRAKTTTRTIKSPIQKYQ